MWRGGQEGEGWSAAGLVTELELWALSWGTALGHCPGVLSWASSTKFQLAGSGLGETACFVLLELGMEGQQVRNWVSRMAQVHPQASVTHLFHRFSESMASVST